MYLRLRLFLDLTTETQPAPNDGSYRPMTIASYLPRGRSMSH